MKLVIILAVVAWTNGDKLDKTYLPPSHARSSGGAGNFLQTPHSPSQEYRGPGSQNTNNYGRNSNGFSQNGNRFNQNANSFAQNGNSGEYNVNGFDNGFETRPERAQAAFERNAAILRQDTSNDGETYSFAYETENGITAEKNGVATNGVEAQGGFSYTGDDGQVYSIRYTADQNGFVPEGDHLPTPPPIPEEILKALEQNARDEAAGIYDDGSYNEGKYSNGNEVTGNGYNGNGYTQNNFNNQADDDSVVTNSALHRSNVGFRNGANGNSRGVINNRGNGVSNGVSNAYLPPSQRNGNSRNGFGSRNRQPTYNDKEGYRF